MAKLTATIVVTHPVTGQRVPLLAGREVPAWAEPLVGGHVEGDLRDDRYDDLTVADLEGEIRARNHDRDDDDRLSTRGRKADLIATLKADDRA